MACDWTWGLFRGTGVRVDLNVNTVHMAVRVPFVRCEPVPFAVYVPPPCQFQFLPIWRLLCGAHTLCLAGRTRK